MSDFTNRINRVKTEAEKLNEPLKGVVLEIINLISDLYKSPLHTEPPPVYHFIEEENLKSHKEYIVGMAYYLYKFEDVDPFNVDDIKNMYNEARIPPPKSRRNKNRRKIVFRLSINVHHKHKNPV